MHLLYMRNGKIWMVHHIFRRRSSFKGFNNLSILKERNFNMFQCFSYLAYYYSNIIQGFVIIKNEEIVESRERLLNLVSSFDK